MITGSGFEMALQTAFHPREADHSTISAGDVEPNLELNKLERAAEREFHHIASVPAIVIEQWLTSGLSYGSREFLP
jgi:hypothetical protein